MTVSFKHHNSFFANLLVDVRTYFLHQTTLKAEATIGNTHTQKKKHADKRNNIHNSTIFAKQRS